MKKLLSLGECSGMIQLSIDIKTGGLGQIFSKYPVEANKMVQDEFGAWARRTTNKARNRAPYKTGNLSRSIRESKSDSGATASANAEYAQYVEPPPLGVPMKRRMTRTQFLYNSAMEEFDVLLERLNERINDYFDGKK